MSVPRAPFERLLPAWLVLSVVVHAAAFSTAALLPRKPRSEHRPIRWVIAGTVTPPQPSAQVTQEPEAAPARRIEVPPTTNDSPPRPRRLVRTERRPRRAATPYVPDTTIRRSSPEAQPQSVSSEVQNSERTAVPSSPASASAPVLGRAGAAFDGALAGGGAAPIARALPGPATFAVTTPAPVAGSGPGLGGSGSGLGVGGTAAGVGGGGAPGADGIGTGGDGRSDSGYLVSGGGPGHGPGVGASTVPPLRAAPAPHTRPEPEAQSQPAPVSRPEPKPQPQPEPEPEADPEPPSPPKPSQADLSRFRAMVQSRIQAARRYPSSARQQGQEGTVRVRFSVSPSGSPGGIFVISSSGFPALDNEAVRAVRRAAPFRPFPPGLNSSISVTATVTFRLN